MPIGLLYGISLAFYVVCHHLVDDKTQLKFPPSEPQSSSNIWKRPVNHRFTLCSQLQCLGWNPYGKYRNPTAWSDTTWWFDDVGIHSSLRLQAFFQEQSETYLDRSQVRQKEYKMNEHWIGVDLTTSTKFSETFLLSICGSAIPVSNKNTPWIFLSSLKLYDETNNVIHHHFYCGN